MNNKVGVEIRLNNTIFQCVLDGKRYNLSSTKAYAIAAVLGVIPEQTQMTINIDAQVICEHCWQANSNGKGLDLKNPSPIVTADAEALRKIKN